MSSKHDKNERFILNEIKTVLNKFENPKIDDIGLALLEFWSYIADLLTYYQEKIAEEAYLETARKRVSILCARLLKTFMPIKFERSVFKSGDSFRITIPIEIIKTLNIKEKDCLTVWLNDSQIIMEKPNPNP